MILRVAEICKKAQNKKNIYVATDNRAIKNLVEKNGLNVIMTSSKCKTGTDRVAEASKKINAVMLLTTFFLPATFNSVGELPHPKNNIINNRLKENFM